eukprot:scaffold20738_cov29-Tisochrysis_lutea.AAC.4
MKRDGMTKTERHRYAQQWIASYGTESAYHCPLLTTHGEAVDATRHRSKSVVNVSMGIPNDGHPPRGP